jgi:hypothetical protein
MKQLLIATAALSLIGGAAFAQTTAATPGAYASPGSTQGAQAGADPSTGTNDNSNVAPGATTTAPVNNGGAAQTPSSAASDTSGSTSMPNASDSNGATASNMASPPASYPVCTSKHEDRCVNRSQATRMASNGMRTRHMKSTSSSTTTDQTPTATPGL